jgi:hypothetical protein
VAKFEKLLLMILVLCGVLVPSTLKRYYEPRGILMRSNRTSVSLYRPVASGRLASHETSRPRNITLSQRAISNTPV